MPLKMSPCMQVEQKKPEAEYVCKHLRCDIYLAAMVQKIKDADYIHKAKQNHED